MALCAILVMPVTTSTATVLSDCAPALVPPVGAVTLTVRVRPEGMAEPMLAVILAPVWLVVTAQVAPAVALVGAEPAVAVLITSDGLPLKAIWLMASTWKATDCVAVWAEATPLMPARRAKEAKRRLAFISVNLAFRMSSCCERTVALLPLQPSVGRMTVL